MKRLTAGLTALLAACGPAEEPRANQAATAEADADEPAASAAAVNATSEPEAPAAPSSDGLGSLPPADASLRFVGRWAANAGYCADKAWRFSATELSTPAGSHCRFDDVRKVPGGYDIAAVCTAEGPPAEDRITLRFAESARAMLFESDSIADAGLVYCGK